MNDQPQPPPQSRERLREEMHAAVDALADALQRIDATCRIAPGEAVIQWYRRDGQWRVAVHITRLTVL